MAITCAWAFVSEWSESTERQDLEVDYLGMQVAAWKAKKGKSICSRYSTSGEKHCILDLTMIKEKLQVYLIRYTVSLTPTMGK